MKLLNKSKFYAILTTTLILASGVALAGRAFMTEYGYYDSQGNYTGSITYPCYGRPIIEGFPSGTAVLESQFSCF